MDALGNRVSIDRAGEAKRSSGDAEAARNPGVAILARRTVHEILQGVCNVRLVPPMDYASFVALIVRAHILLTDSGGLQEEGPALGKPVLVMREISERPEGMSAGASVRSAPYRIGLWARCSRCSTIPSGIGQWRGRRIRTATGARPSASWSS